MKQNIKILEEASTFNKEYYRNKYVEAIDKITTMTSKIVDLQERLINSQNDKDWLKEDVAAKDRQIKRLKGLKIKKK